MYLSRWLFDLSLRTASQLAPPFLQLAFQDACCPAPILAFSRAILHTWPSRPQRTYRASPAMNPMPKKPKLPRSDC